MRGEPCVGHVYRIARAFLAMNAASLSAGLLGMGDRVDITKHSLFIYLAVPYLRLKQDREARSNNVCPKAYNNSHRLGSHDRWRGCRVLGDRAVGTEGGGLILRLLCTLLWNYLLKYKLRTTCAKLPAKLLHICYLFRTLPQIIMIVGVFSKRRPM